MMTTITTVNVYRNRGEWCYSADTPDGYDHSDVLGIDDHASVDEAIAEARSQFPGATVAKVDDTNIG